MTHTNQHDDRNQRDHSQGNSLVKLHETSVRLFGVQGPGSD